MKAFVTSALCASLVVPALIQPAMANFDATGNAQKFLLQTISTQTQFVSIVKSATTKKTGADEAAQKIEKLTASYKKTKATMDSATPAERLAVERLSMIDPTNTKKKEAAAADATSAIKALKATDYAASPALKKACTDFASLFGYKI